MILNCFNKVCCMKDGFVNNDKKKFLGKVQLLKILL